MARKAAVLEAVEPAYLWVPDHASTAGGEAADLAASAGLDLDLEQRIALDAILAERPDGRWAALEAGLCEARQNGKTVTLQAIALADLFLFNARLVIWSAHLFDTTLEAFRDLITIIDGAPHLSKRCKPPIMSNGKEAIELHTGQRIRFKARTKTGGRGLSGDRVFLDEAMVLGDAEMGSLFPTLSARPNPSVVYAGSAGLPTSARWRALRDRGRPGGDPSLVWVEWGAPQFAVDGDGKPVMGEDGKSRGVCKDEDCDHAKSRGGCALDDPAMVHQANPALHRRIGLEYTQGERRTLPPHEYARERLTWWEDPPEGEVELPMAKWDGCARRDLELAAEDEVVLAVDVAPNHAAASIVACGGIDGLLEIPPDGARSGASWVVPYLVKERDAGRATTVGLDPSGPAGALIPDLKAAGFTVRDDKANPAGELVLLGGAAMNLACAGILAAVIDGKAFHRDQAALNEAATAAVRRQVGDAWRWSRKDTTANISPIVAATIARYLWSVGGVGSPVIALTLGRS